jgi:hypothetical protein
MVTYRKKACIADRGNVILRGWTLQTDMAAQVLKEEHHRCQFRFHMSLPPSRRACHERGDVAIVESAHGDVLPSHPSGKGSRDRSFLA